MRWPETIGRTSSRGASTVWGASWRSSRIRSRGAPGGGVWFTSAGRAVEWLTGVSRVRLGTWECGRHAKTGRSASTSGAFAKERAEGARAPNPTGIAGSNRGPATPRIQRAPRRRTRGCSGMSRAVEPKPAPAAGPRRERKSAWLSERSPPMLLSGLRSS
jgi:hypothetical protein